MLPSSRRSPQKVFLPLLSIILAGLYFWPSSGLCGYDPFSASADGLATISTPHGATIYAEIADTPAKRSRGLMFRTHLAPDHGMLFVFQKSGNWTFWMKNTKIPLDLIWLDANGIVVHIEPHVPICTRKDEGCPRYHSPQKALFVLELGAGRSAAFDISLGTPLTITWP